MTTTGCVGGGPQPHLADESRSRVRYLDSDFIETIDDLNRCDYLREMLKNPRDIERIRQIAGPEANLLVLVFHEALGGFDAQVDGWAPKSTPRLTCCGAFPCTI